MTKKINIVDKTKKKVDCSCNSDDKNCDSLELSETEFGKAIEEKLKSMVDVPVDYWIKFTKIPSYQLHYLDYETKYHVIKETSWNNSGEDELLFITIVNPNYDSKSDDMKEYEILVHDMGEWKIVDYKEDEKCDQEPTILGNEFPDVYSIKYPNKNHEIDKVWSYSFPICGDKVENTNSWLDSNNNEYYKLLGATSDMNVCKVWKGGDNEKKHNLVEIDLETIIECFSYIYCVLCETEDNNTVFAPNHYFSQVTGLDNHPVSEFAHISDDKIKAMLMRVLDLFDISFLEQKLRVFSRYIPFKSVPLTHVAKYLKAVMDSYNDSYGDKDYFWLNECKCIAIEYARQSDFVNEGDVIKLEVGNYKEEIFEHSSDVISEILDKQKEQHYNNVSYMKGIIKKFNDIFRSNKGFNKILHIGKSEDTVDESCDNDDVRSFNCGYSDYCKHKIQPWDIWIEYDLNPFDADIVKRVLREKHEENMTPEESRILDYEKIIHVSRERIRQLKEKLKEKQNN